MSCSVCMGYTHAPCPCCGGTEENTTLCEACQGKGTIYYALDLRTDTISRCTQQAFLCLPTEDIAVATGKRYCQWEECVCGECNGTGEIVIEPMDEDNWCDIYED